MLNRGKDRSLKTISWQVAFVVLLMLIFTASSAFGFVLRVVDGKTGADLTTAFRYLVQVDNTFDTIPGATVTDQSSFSIHDSNAPLAVMAVGGAPAQGHSATNGISVGVLHDNASRYYVSVLPDTGYAVGGAPVAKTATDTTEVVVFVEKLAIPTAQISVFVFKDHWPINNAPDDLATEPGIEDATLVVSDAGGPLWQDAFGNPIGTVYDRDDATCLDSATFDPVTCLVQLGSGVVTTLTNEDYCANLGFGPGSGIACDEGTAVTPPTPSVNPYDLMPGEAVVKFMPPGKYGIVVIPPTDGSEYVLTSTIEGTPTVDAWVQADEAQFFIEQFGAASPWHAFFGYVTPAELPWAVSPPTGPGSIAGENRFMHFSRPPNNQTLDIGPPVDSCWVGVNDAVTGQGLYAVECNPDSTFTIDVPGVPVGDYELATWDKPLDALFSFHPVKVPETIDAQGNPIAPNYSLNKTLLSSRWFGTLKGNVFLDSNENGFRDAGEGGLFEQAVLLRFRDGTIYQATVSDPAGDYELTEVFPFFKWLVVEVDFARYKATGMTAAVDMGGTIPTANGWTVPSFDSLTPQPQTTDGTFTGPAINNPNTGNKFSRTETGEVLTQAMQTYLTQTNVIDWGKNFYGPGVDNTYGTKLDENGGISGIVYYAVTRAEDDPKWAAAEGWEPGIPNVQITLYHDDVAPYGRIDCLDDTTGLPVVNQPACTPELADVDNYPFNWSPMFEFLDEAGTVPNPDYAPTSPGPEDIDHNANDAFNFGDAVQITYTDSWDASKPTGCIQDLPVIHGNPVNPCADSYGTWNQVRPGVFDGGYAFGDHYEKSMHVDFGATNPDIRPLQSGTFIVEAGTPHGYIQIREEDKNVDFGDEFVPSPNALPAVCVGDLHTVPQALSLWTDAVAGDPGNDFILSDTGYTATDIPAPYAGQSRPYCDRKQVSLNSGLNAPAEFFFFTKVPIAARGMGFINNDLAPEFNMASPAFGEKMSPSWLPVSLRDWAGREVAHTYSDEFGSYEFLVPGSYTVNQASPTGVTLAMYNIIINDPMMPDPADPVNNRIADPWHSPDYAVAPWVFQFETGRTSYIDSPIVPTAAFVGYPQGNLDVNPPAGVPLIDEVTQGNGDPGALACNVGDSIIITSLGNVDVPNPNYDPSAGGSSPVVSRDYGFGASQGAGTVSLNGVLLTVTAWSNTSITATVEAGVGGGGDLVVTRDNGNANAQPVTVTVGGCGTTYRYVAETGTDTVLSGSAVSPYASIQYAVDQASAGDTIFVAAGTYNERVILYKELTLQGSGSGTVIDSRPAVQSLVQVWRDKLSALGGTPAADTEIPGIMVTDPTGTFNGATAPNVVVDGFQVTGGTTAGGIYIHDHGYNAIVRNNNVTGNQGVNSGGITVGVPEATMAGNTGIQIISNTVTKNSGVNGGGGITLYSGSTNYVVAGNVVQANLSRQFGGGISHEGLSDGGLIEANVVAFNEVFYFAANGGDGGGIYVGSEGGGSSSGSVTINANLIQGNLSGSSYGGGIRVSGLNSATDTTSAVSIYNNMIVNNVASIAGGGISLQDAVNVEIVNNTIANNDSTSTAQLAFPNTNLNPSEPRPAGVQAGVHSAALAAALPGGNNIPDPTLVNNIIYQNRSYFHQGLNVGGNALSLSGFWDLGITGEPVAGTNALDPENCLLTSLTGVNGENYNDGTNLVGDPKFLLEYRNTLESAATLDEGGNNISVRFTELTLDLGNYHIVQNSAALNVGQAVTQTELLVDYDGENRPAGIAPEAGADELPILRLNAPNGGESLVVGTTTTVSWDPTSGAASYLVRYSIDGGTSWRTIQNNITATSISWKIPNRPSTTALVKVFARNAGGTNFAADVSDAVFSIVSRPQVLGPNGGETLNVGGTVAVTWAGHPDAVSHLVRYSIDGGTTWKTIQNNVAGTSLNWTVPNKLSTTALVKVIARNAGGTLFAGDVSDAVFTIQQPLQLFGPNGGEALAVGGNTVLAWSAHPDAASYRLLYSTNAGGSWSTIKYTVNGTSHNWTVPNQPSTQTLVKVQARGAGGALLTDDVSDGAFTIYQPLQVLSPNGGETLNVGSDATISWNAHPLAVGYLVSYSTDNGANWTKIGNAAGTSLVWPVANVPGSQTLIKVQARNAGGALFTNDVSDAAFTIEQPLRIVTPNGGGSLDMGALVTIVWEAHPDAVSYLLRYSTDNGASWTWIKNNVTGTSRLWTVPSIPTTQGLVKINARNAAGDLFTSDTSDRTIVFQ